MPITLLYKRIKGDTIKTNIKLLSQEERITAIAKMLSGEKAYRSCAGKMPAKW